MQMRWVLSHNVRFEAFNHVVRIMQHFEPFGHLGVVARFSLCGIGLERVEAVAGPEEGIGFARHGVGCGVLGFPAPNEVDGVGGADYEAYGFV